MHEFIFISALLPQIYNMYQNNRLHLMTLTRVYNYKLVQG